MTLSRTITVMDVYDRAKTGERVEEKEWDYKIIPKTASALKKKYGIKMDKKKIIPEDPELCSNLFKAGLELLATCGVYCIDTNRVIKYTEEEILASLEAAPKSAQYGEVGLNGRMIACRRHDDKRPPIIQGGPTGAPCSEKYFQDIHQTYAQEPIVDTIVDGVMQTIKGKDPMPGTPWEIAAVKAEAKAVREAQMRAGRDGMGL